MKKTLTLKEAALAAERAYRRGFQQGVVFTHRMNVQEDDAFKFRYETPYDKPYGAPEKFINKKNIEVGPPCLLTLVERLKLENEDIFDDRSEISES